MTRAYDVIVLGLGGIGSGAAYWAAKRGARVLGLEQFELGHVRGGSHDHSRIIRLSYHAAHYVRLAKAAYAAWHEVEEDAGTQLVYKTGGLDIGPRGGAIDMETYARALSECDVAFERLDAAEIRRRFPPFQVDETIHAIFQADTGIVAAARATETHQQLARALGADLREHTPAIAVHDSGGEIVIETERERFSAGKLIVTAGAWISRIFELFDVHVALEVTKEQVMYFRPPSLEPFALGRFPVWIWLDDPSFYGFPVFGEPAVKITQDAGGKPVDPQTRTFEPDEDITQRVRAFIQARLPSAFGPEHYIKTCLYTLPPDRDFIVDALPGHPNVHVLVCAGHGFKFASVLGRILVELSLDGRTGADISHLKIDRPVLRMNSPPTSYMV